MKKIENIKSIEDFFAGIGQTKCICFGAGRKLDEICRELPELAVKMAYIVDNNPALYGKERKVGGEAKIIYSPQKLEEEDISKVLVIMTSSYKKEIIEQLEQKKIFQDMAYCEIEIFLDAMAWGVECPPVGYKKNANEKIPKRIHYIWFSDNEIPLQLQKNIDGWKRLCPDYEICCWNERNYDISKNPYMYKAYQSRMWSFVSDYARLDIIYANGGIYLDTDVEMLRRPDELLYNDAFIGFERISTVNTGAGFGAVKGFPLIKGMRDLYDNIEFKVSADPYDMVLCPIYETGFLESHGLQLNGKYQVVDGMTVYPVMYFNAKSLYSDRMLVTKETISIHHCTWTWAGEKNKLGAGTSYEDNSILSSTIS